MHLYNVRNQELLENYFTVLFTMTVKILKYVPCKGTLKEHSVKFKTNSLIKHLILYPITELMAVLMDLPQGDTHTHSLIQLPSGAGDLY